MDFSQISIKKFLSLVVLLLLSQNLSAQNEDPIYPYVVEIIDKNYFNVTVSKSKNYNLPLVFKLPTQVPNFYIKESIQNEISDFYIINNGKKVKIEPFQSAYKINQDFDYLTYKVKFKQLVAKDFAIVQTFYRNDYLLLTFANFLGGFEEGLVSLKVIKNKQTVFEKVAALSSFYSSPICVGCQKKNFASKNLDIEVYHNQNDKKFLTYVSEALDAFKILGFEEKLENKKMIFVLDSLNRNEGAIAHKNHIVFNFNEIDKYQIQKTILHEMIHWVVPDLQSWLNESVAEFLAIKLLMKSGLISDEKFLEIIAEKIRVADRYKKYSLDDLFRNKTELSVKQNYRALYSKGAVLAFVLDAILFKQPNIDITLEKYVLKGVKSKNEKLNLELIEELVSFEKSYVIDNKNYSYNMFLNELGILFEENKVLEIKAKQNILLKKDERNIIIVDNGGVNQLEEKDVLLKLNGASDYEEIKEKLKEKSEKSSCFVVLRNGKKKKIKISNKESLFVRKKFNLSFFVDRTQEQKDNWKKYIY